MGRVTITRFDPTVHTRAWDSFITDEAVNSTFIHQRGYMDYHGDRFNDFSLVVTDLSGKIIALLPATKSEETVSSHPGLTFGGFLTGKKCHHSDIAATLEAMIVFLKENGIDRLSVTQPPFIYQSRPTGDIEYMFATRLNGTVTRRRLLSVIDIESKPSYSELRKRGFKKAEAHGLTVRQSHDIDVFYSMLSANLADRYNATPVHSPDEIKLLATRFPDNISLYMTFDGECPIAGTIIYKSGKVVKTQYIASTPDGRVKGAVDMLIMSLIDIAAGQGYRYIDLGSSESSPGIINDGLLLQKEGFGARGVCLDTYTINIK